MIPKDSIIRAVSLMLLGFGLFQIIASLIAVIFLVLTGHWSNHVSQIAAIAFWLTLPITYLVWKKYFGEKFSS
ncbi:MAG: hypothetical protein JW953_05285 [Anaerolineae bacterium]|nr:hypothetical protein [Anaerolineae bacterium]